MYHFIGIKGSGMSSLALIMEYLGYEIEGSDYNKHYFTEKNLIKNNIKILPFNKENIKENMIIVKGNTFNEENEEVKEAIKKNLKIYTYEEMVSIITSKYDLIAVSGCHGKTTTSSMLAHVLKSNYLIGDGSGKINKSNYFVLEACEYKKHFLKYNPKTIIITNIDLDHVDYYNNIEEVIKAYQEFANISKTLIVCGDNKYSRRIKHKVKYTYGIKTNNHFQAKNIEYSESGMIFDLYINKEFKYKFNLPFYGKHMILNTLAVISFCYLNNIKLDKIEKRLKTFKGAKRRFKEKKVLDNIIIDDYAHHPNEVKALIEATKQKYKNKKIIGIFEPHTFSRTKKFYKEIAKELNKTDYSYIMDIYKSREKQEDYKEVTSNLIIKNLKNGEHLKKEQISKLLKHHNSVLLFMSPNDLMDLQKEYIKKYKNQNEPPK